MAVGFYQFYLIPIENRVSFTDEGIDFIGDGYVLFDSIKTDLVMIEHVMNYSPLDKWLSFEDECHYCYDDGSYKVELELNTGTKEEKITEISIRASIYRSYGNISLTLNFCEGLCTLISITQSRLSL